MASVSVWDRLSFDLTQLILSYLPLRSLLRSSAVCRLWLHAASSLPPNPANPRPPWLFLLGLNNVVSRLHQSFAFDPLSHSWSLLPPPHPDSFSGASGFSFAASSCSRFAYSPLLAAAGTAWRFTKPLTFPRCNPLVAVFDENRFVVVGGVRYIGGLVDLEDRLAVEIYDPAADAWEVGPPLPVDFRSGGSSSQWLSAALLPERKVLYVFGIYSCDVAAFDLSRRVWTGGVGTLRPHGTLFAFLLAGPGDSLLLAGLCTADQQGGNVGGAQPCFAIWAVDPLLTGQPKRIAVMPGDLLTGLFGTDDDDNQFASLRCVGMDGWVYVFNEDHHKGYPACVCQIQGKEMDQCSWRRIPPLPGPVNRFHKTIAFSSGVPLGPIFRTTTHL